MWVGHVESDQPLWRGPLMGLCWRGPSEPGGNWCSPTAGYTHCSWPQDQYFSAANSSHTKDPHQGTSEATTINVARKSEWITILSNKIPPKGSKR